jgi:transcriptional regulator with XRE-family HTH domain
MMGSDGSLPAITKAALAEERLKLAIGRRVRSARLERGWTGTELAARTGVTSAFISQIERGLGTPSLSTLLRLIVALDITVGDLFAIGQPVAGVLRRQDWERVQYDTTEDAILATDRRGRLHAIWSRFPAQTTTAVDGDGSEVAFAFVLAGEIELVVGDTRHVLDQHASVVFDSGLPHTWSNTGRDAAEVVVVVTQAAEVAIPREMH